MKTMRRVLNLGPADRAWLALTALLAFATLGAGIGLLATSSYLISRAALVDTTVVLALGITAVRFFAVGRATFRYGERYVGHLTTFRILTRVREWCFAALTPRAPLALHAGRRGDVVARLGPDVDELQHVALRVLVPPVASGLAIVTAGLVLGFYAPVLGLVLASALGVCGVLIPVGIRAAGRRAAHAAVDARGALYGAYIEALDGADELIVNGRPDLLRAPTAEAALLGAQRRLARVDAIGTAIGSLAAGATVLTVLALAIPLVTRGELDGVFLALVPLVALAAFEAIPPLAAAVAAFDRGRAAAGRLAALADGPGAVADPADPVAVPTTGPVALDAVSFRYPGAGSVALHDVSISVGAGEVVGLTGPSGCGKSTVVALLERFAAPQTGSITIGGVPVDACTGDAVREHFAVVQQPDHLFDTTLRDNLRLGDPDADDLRMHAALEAVALDALPDGLDTSVGPNGSHLSGGERQRALIARALLAERPVLVLDEATSHLDRETEARVFAGIREWRGDQAMLVIAHDAERLPLTRIVTLR